MFEKIPVVGYKLHHDAKPDMHYFRNWLKRVNAGKEVYYNKKYLVNKAKLEQLEESICSGVKQINNKFVFIGELLRCIDDECLYTTVYSGFFDKNCADIYRYAFVRFGLKKTSTFNLISIARRFATNGELDKPWKEFSYSQLCEMLSMSDEDRKKVTPDMSVKQIRELKNTLALQADVQTSELSSEDYEISDEEVQLENVVSKKVKQLADILEEGDAYHLWFDGKKDFSVLAEWLLSKGVSVK